MNHALGAVRDEECPRPGERHVEKTPFLIRILRQGNDPVLSPGDENHGELQPFRGVEREERHSLHPARTLAFTGEQGQADQER